MTEATGDNVVVWLMPAADDATALQALVDALTTRFGAATFAPHVTLGKVRDRSPAGCRAAVASLGADLARPVTATLEDLRRYPETRRSLVLDLAPDDRLHRLRAALPNHGVEPDDRPPHLSLAYHPLTEDEFEALAVEVRPQLPQRIEFTGLRCVAVPPAAGDAIEPQHWRTLPIE